MHVLYNLDQLDASSSFHLNCLRRTMERIDRKWQSSTSEGEPFSAEDDSESTVKDSKVRQMAITRRLNPLELEMDPTVSWVYRPSVLTCLGVFVGSTILFAYHSENLVVPAKVFYTA